MVKGRIGQGLGTEIGGFSFFQSGLSLFRNRSSGFIWGQDRDLGCDY